MFVQVDVFFCCVFSVGAQRIPSLFGRIGTIDDILLGDAEDQDVLSQLVHLDVINRPLIKKILELDIPDRKIIGDLARGILQKATQIADKDILGDLVKLDKTLMGVLSLDGHHRKILIDLMEVINLKTLQKGPRYPMALWKRLLKINGYGGFFGTGQIWGENYINASVVIEDWG